MPELIAKAIIKHFALTGTAATLVTIGTYVVTTAVTVFAAKKMAEQSGLDGLESNMGSQLKMQFRSDHPRRLVYGTTKLSGPVAFVATSDAPSGDNKENKYLHLVVLLGDGPFTAIDNVFFGDTDLQLTSAGSDSSGNGIFVPGSGNKYDGLVRVKKHLGSTSQTADPELVSAVGEWTTNHRLRGIAYLYVRLEFDQDRLGNIPNVTAIVRGRQVFDPRNNSTAFSNNPALCIRDFLLSENGLGASASEVDDTRMIEQANVCDQLVTIDSGGTQQKRYELDGTLELNSSPVAIMDQMLASCVGTIPYVQGKHQLQVGAPIPASRNHVIDASYFAGNLVIQTEGGLKDRINACRGTFMDPDNNYNVVDFSPYTDSTYENADGERLWADVAFNFVKDNKRAQRIAKLLVERNRQSQAISVRCNLKAFNIAVNDTITLTVDRDGTGGENAIFTNKKYRVSSWTLRADGSIDLEAVEEANALYNFNFGDTFGIDVAPNTSLPNPRFTAAPTNVQLSEGADLNQDGAVLTSLQVTFTKASDAFTGQYEIFLDKNIGGSTFLPISSQRVGASVNKVTFSGLQVGQTFRASVQAISVIDVRSALAVSSNITLQGDNTPPAVVTPTAVAGHKRVKISWTNPSDVDFAGVEIFRRKNATGAPANNVAATISVGGVPGQAQDILDEGLDNNANYRYWLRTVDYSGNKSAFRPNNNSGVLATPSAESLTAYDNSSTGFVDAAGAGAAAPVQSVTVNGGTDVTDSSGNADISAVTGIQVNSSDISGTNGVVNISAITGIDLNGVATTASGGVVDLEALTGIEFNGSPISVTSASDGTREASISAMTGLSFNGSAVSLNNGSGSISALTGVSLNGSNVTVSNGTAAVSAVTGVSLNGSAVTVNNGTASVSAVTGVDLNGSAVTVTNGTASVSAVTGVSVNGSSTTVTNGTAAVNAVTGVSVNGSAATVTSGTAAVNAITEVKLNGSTITPSSGSVDVQAVNEVKLNGSALTATTSTAGIRSISIAAVDEVKINGTTVSATNGSVDLSVLTGINFNGTALTASNGSMSLSALTGATITVNNADGTTGTVSGTVDSNGDLSLGAMANIDSITTANASLFLANTIITNSMLAGNIAAGKLDVAKLSAITANVGTLAAGKLQNVTEEQQAAGTAPTFVIDLANGTITIST